MALDLHPDLSPLPRWQRILYGACLVLGLTGLALFCVAILVEVFTSPPSGSRAWWVLVPAGYSIWHVTREVPAWGPLPRLRWALFTASALGLAAKAFSLIADPTAALFFALAGLLSFGLIALARLLARRAGPPVPEDSLNED